jgi:hypothetical protein
MSSAVQEARQAMIMRCVACGVEMKLVQTVPDNSTIASGRELGTFECPRCHGRAQRLMTTNEITPFATERMALPAGSSPLLADAMNRIVSARHRAQILAQSWLARARAVVRGLRDRGR